VAFVAGVTMGGASIAQAAPVVNFDTGVLPENGYAFDPASIHASSLCGFPYVTPPNNGRCLKEDRQGVVTTMTRVDGEAFSIQSFYFLLTGNGTGSSNSITITNDDDPTKTVTFAHSGDYDAGPSTVRFELADGTAGSLAGVLDNQIGYIAFLDPSFGFSKSWTWSAATTAQVRLDNIYATVIPLPAAAWLLLAGLGGIGLMSWRKVKPA
jgi:hypothetical protein